MRISATDIDTKGDHVAVPAGWFPGAGRSGEDEAFLAELRLLASSSGLVDVEAGQTHVIRLPALLVLQVQPPGLPTSGPAPLLEVGFDLSETQPYLVGGWETWAYVLDDAEEIDVADAEPTAPALAARAHRWFVEQLSRPVERATWRTLVGPPRSHYRLADTGEFICATGSLLRFRGGPASVERVR
jgi:hypothetical protein